MSHFTSKQFLNYRITLPLIWGCAMLASQALAYSTSYGSALHILAGDVQLVLCWSAGIVFWLCLLLCLTSIACPPMRKGRFDAFKFSFLAMIILHIFLQLCSANNLRNGWSCAPCIWDWQPIPTFAPPVHDSSVTVRLRPCATYPDICDFEAVKYQPMESK